MTTCAQPTYRSSGSIFSGRLFTKGLGKQPSFRITVDRYDHQYDALDRVWGQVAIVCMIDTPFRDVNVDLVGETCTNIDRISTPTGVTSFAAGFHKFLTLEQPDCLRGWQGERVFKAGRPYFFPFTFTIPDELTSNICQHPIADENVRSSHLKLPPSLGYHRRGLLGSSDTLSEKVTIRYLIRTSFCHLKAGHRTSALTSSERLIIHVVPTMQDRNMRSLLPSADISPISTSLNVSRSLVFRKPLQKSH